MACSKHFIYHDDCHACVAEKALKEQQRMHEEALEEQQRMHDEALGVARDLDERAEQRAFEQQIAHEQALRESDERQKRIRSEEWKLQAQAKAREAHEQFKLGRLDAALKLARQAIEQNPANIRAFMVASWVLEKQGAHQEARSLYLEQFSLLRSEKYSSTFSLIEEVLDNLPLDKGLLQEFSKRVTHNLPRWKLEDCIALVEKLITRQLLDFTSLLTLLRGKSVAAARLATSILLLDAFPPDCESRAAFFALLQRNITYWNFFDCIVLVDRMIGKGFVDEARSIMKGFTVYSFKEQIRSKQESLLFYASWLGIADLLGNSSDQPLIDFLQGVAFTERFQILEAFQTIEYDPEVIRKYTTSGWTHGGVTLSPATLERVKSRIVERYNEWKREIDSSLTEAARSKATSRDAKRVYIKQNKSFLGSPAAFGWSVGLISAICAGLWGSPTGVAIFGPLIGLTGALIRSSQLEEAIFRKELKNLTFIELSKWGQIVGEGGSPILRLEQPGSPSGTSGAVSKARVPSLLSLTLISMVIVFVWDEWRSTGPRVLTSKYPSAACFVDDCPPCQREPIKLERRARITFDLSSCFQMVDADASMRWNATDLNDLGYVARIGGTGQKFFLLPQRQGMLARDRSGSIRSLPPEFGDAGRVGSRRQLEFAGIGRMQLSAE